MAGVSGGTPVDFACDCGGEAESVSRIPRSRNSRGGLLRLFDGDRHRSPPPPPPPPPRTSRAMCVVQANEKRSHISAQGPSEIPGANARSRKKRLRP